MTKRDGLWEKDTYTFAIYTDHLQRPGFFFLEL